MKQATWLAIALAIWYNKNIEKGAENLWLAIQKIQKSSNIRIRSVN